MLKLAEAGDVAALKLLDERIAGSPVPSDVLDRLQRIEEAFEQREDV